MTFISDEIVQEFRSTCRSILRECPDGYARAYASAGMSLSDRSTIKAQIHYILSNTAHWQGETARFTKAKLNSLAKLLAK